MKKNIQAVLRPWLAAIVGIGLIGVPAIGRSTHLITFNVAQEMNVTGVKLPAGKYTILDLGMSNGYPVLQIRSDDTNRQVITFAHFSRTGLDAAKESSVAFQQDGDAYRLVRVRVAGQISGYSIPFDPERE
jgi:pectin methylesterase-like acyl-CoA thioesterase